MENPKLRRSHHPKHGGPPCLLEELMINILSRLSSKILCRFKCVSKDFLLLISSDSQFKDLHRSRFSKNPRLLQYDLSISDGSDGLEPSYLLSQTTFDLTSGQECDTFGLAISKAPGKNASFIQVTSCRELVCIYTHRKILVSNPSTHQFISLDAKNEILQNSVGIGYVNSCKEYKVVTIDRAKSRLLYRDLGCQVYTVKDGSCDYTITTKIFEGTPQDNFYDVALAEQLPICVDGILYWLSITCHHTKKMVVYYLNLEDNSYGNFPFPEGDKVGNDEKGATMAKLVELQGYLCIQCSSLESEGFLVYALKDTKLGLWEQVYNILYPPGIDWNWIFLLGVPLSKHETLERMSYMPAMSYIAPNVLGFLPSNNSGNGVPHYVLSEHIDYETYRVHIVDNGTIKTSADFRFRPRRTRRLLYYEGLFSFKSL